MQKFRVGEEMMRVFDESSGTWLTSMVLPQKWYPVRSRDAAEFPLSEQRKLPLEKFQAMNKPFCWTVAVGKWEGSESGGVAKTRRGMGRTGQP